jgi:hypothetical protein
VAGAAAVSRRESPATCPLGADQLALLAMHRLLPERSLPDLLVASARVNDPARAALFHFAQCVTCTAAAFEGTGALCARGTRLVTTCRGWRAREAAGR